MFTSPRIPRPASASESSSRPASPAPALVRLGASLAIVAVIVSMLGLAFAHAAPPDNDLPDPTRACGWGEEWSEQTNQCEPVPTPELSVPIGCPEGEEPNGNGGCIPIQLSDEDCPEGEVVLDNECVPSVPPECPPGEMADDRGNCVPDPNQPDPSDPPPGCEDGMVHDEQGDCVPDPDAVPHECQDGYILDKDWNCIPDPNQTPPEAPTQDDQQGGSITVTYHRCADSITPSTDLEWLLNNCKPIEDIGFTGTFGDQVETGKTGPNGQVVFTDVPLGKWSITPIGLDLPDPIMILSGCESRLGFEVQHPLQFEQLETLIGESSQPGGDWDCHYVELVLPDALDVTKYSCPAGVSRATPLNTLRTTCATASGVLFHLYDKSGSFDQTTDASGHASWRGLGHSGFTWRLQEEIPAGYGQPAVHCRTLPDGPWTQVDAPAARIPITFPEDGGSGMECEWFNLLAAEQGVFIRTLKYICPYGTPPDLDEGEWRDVCEPGEGVEFTGDFNGTVLTNTTGVDGMISWGEVPIGSWTMAESFPGEPTPAPYLEPIVFCYFANPPLGSTVDRGLFARTPSGMSVSGTYTDDHRGLALFCTWINIRNYPEPPATPDPAGSSLPRADALLPGIPQSRAGLTARSRRHLAPTRRDTP